MARIRTIKPAFFRHEGLYELEIETGLPIRVAFAGLWTAADRDGRFLWRPRELKLDCLPYDDLDFSRVLDALATRGFIRRYASAGVVYGDIPAFRAHQVVNNREAASTFPPFAESIAITATSTRDSRVPDASPTRLHLDEGEGKGREGKGKEGVEARHATRRGSRFALTQLPEDWKSFCRTERPDLDPERTFAKFGDYWRSVPGAKGSKLDWAATWRNFVRTERPAPGAKPPEPAKPWHETASGTAAKGRELGLDPGAFRLPDGREDWQSFRAAVLRKAGVEARA